MKSALILGGGGFIGSHMAKRLQSEGYFVRGVDLKDPEFSNSACNEFLKLDLRVIENVQTAFKLNPTKNIVFDEVYQFAADMGGAGFVFTGENDADIMHNSSLINLNVLDTMRSIIKKTGKTNSKIFYSGSACMYPEHNQIDPRNSKLSEESAYPAAPDSEYGWEKLFSERLYLAFNRNYGIPIAIARYHNIFGPEGTWMGGREKAPAAICRKVAYAKEGDFVEVWGDGEQTRSFLYIDECIDATLRLMRQSDFLGPVNIGSEEMVTINKLVEITSKVAKKSVRIKHIPGPLGVRGRNSDNTLIRDKLNWDSTMSLEQGIELTFHWINNQVKNSEIGESTTVK